VISVSKTTLGLYPESVSATPLYRNLLLAGYDVCLLNNLKDAKDFDLIIVCLDFLFGDLGELFLAIRNKPVLLATEEEEAVEYAAEWGVMGIVGQHWSPKDLRLVIDFFVVKSRYYPRREVALPESGPTPVTILLVEDDLLTAGVVMDSISELGDVVHTSSVSETESVLSQRKFDLIILDVFLPDGNGLTLLRQIKSNPFYEAIPVLVFSVNEDLRAKLEAFELGASDYLLKPFHIAELKARVKALIGGKQKQEVLLCNLKQMSVLAEQDGLTGLYNHRYFVDNLKHRFHLAKEHNIPIAVLMMDVDDFKFYNDRNGHLAGDQVLREVAQIIRTMVRGDDIPARYGGEEFVALLWDVTEAEAVKVAERIREAIAAYPFPQREHQPGGKVTVSIGVAVTPADSPSALLQKADEALYRAKMAGKNKVMT